jgi:hypothetical protein
VSLDDWSRRSGNGSIVVYIFGGINLLISMRHFDITCYTRSYVAETYMSYSAVRTFPS